MSKIREALARPFLPPDARLRLKHQRLDAEAAGRTGWVLQMSEIAVTLVKAVDSPGLGKGVRLEPVVPATGHRPTSTLNDPITRWYRSGAMEWDAVRVTIVGSAGTGAWLPGSGGLQPGFDPVEVFEAGHRPTGCGECLPRVAAIATVGLAGRHLQRIVLLDAEARELCWIPAKYFAEDDIIRFAGAADLAYRSYAFRFANYSSTRVSPAGLCEALFPRSARWVKLLSEEFDDGSDWFTDPRRRFGGTRM